MSNLTRYELPSVRLKGGESATIYTDPVSPRGLVWPVGLEIDPGVAPRLVVNDLKVGKNTQLAAAASVPATLFTLSPPVELLMDKLQPGMRLALTVTCASLEGATFRGRLLAAAPANLAELSTRMHVLGFGCAEVRAGETFEAGVRSMLDVRLRRLHVPPHLLGVFRVDALFQGRYLDVAQASHVSDLAQLSRESLSRGGEITLHPFTDVGAGQPVTLRVTNTSETTQYFSGALLGETVAETGS